MLAAFQSFPYYAGPNEAVFTAIRRKNFGCSHFIVGRDHSGVGEYYEKDAAHRLFDELGPIGIEPVYFNEHGYHPSSQTYKDITKEKLEDFFMISGNKAREMLQKKELPPQWFMRPEVSKLIIDKIENGEDVFT